MTTVTLDAVRAEPNVLAADYAHFAVARRLLLTGHSHQAWPDVALEGQVEAFTDAAREVDAKWPLAEAKAEEVAAGFGALLGDPEGDICLAGSTHDLLVRFLSSLDLARRPRLVTTDAEFHSVRRQLARLAEEGMEVVRVPASPVDTLAERMAAAVDDRTSAVLVSQVLFETARIVPGLGDLARACLRTGTELLVDVYHALGVLEVPIHALGLADAWVLGGGYKYLQLGEGNCFLRLPSHARWLRPVVTGWFAEFGELAEEPDPTRVSYAAGAARFAGATYDPTSHYRAARVFRYRADRGLTPPLLRAVSLHQVGLLREAFDALDLPPELVTRDRLTPPECYAGFLALRSPHAAALRAALLERGVRTDHRGEYLRLGPAPYLCDRQLTDAVLALGDAAATLP